MLLKGAIMSKPFIMNYHHFDTSNIIKSRLKFCFANADFYLDNEAYDI